MLSQAARQTSHAGVSCRNDFIAHEMQPDQLGSGGRVEMAAHGIAHLGVQFVERIGLGENGFACRFGNVAALWRVFDYKNDLVNLLPFRLRRFDGMNFERDL